MTKVKLFPPINSSTIIKNSKLNADECKKADEKLSLPTIVPLKQEFDDNNRFNYFAANTANSDKSNKIERLQRSELKFLREFRKENVDSFLINCLIRFDACFYFIRDTYNYQCLSSEKISEKLTIIHMQIRKKMEDIYLWFGHKPYNNFLESIKADKFELIKQYSKLILKVKACDLLWAQLKHDCQTLLAIELEESHPSLSLLNLFKNFIYSCPASNQDTKGHSQ